jgi:hypothetical protein
LADRVPDFSCGLLTLSNCQAPGKCEDYFADMPDLTILFNNFKFTIPPAGYVFQPNGTVGPCDLAIDQAFSSEYILGDIFFRNFIVKFNYTDSTMSFAVNVNAFEGTSISKVEPTWLWWVVGTAIGLVVLLIAYFFGKRA